MLFRLAPDNGREVFEAAISFYAEPEKHHTRLFNFHDLFFHLDGSWSVFWEDAAQVPEEIILQPGDIAFLPAGYYHRGDKKCLPNTRTMYIHFEALPADRAVKQKETPGATNKELEIESWTRPANSGLVEFFETMVKVQNSPSPFKKTYCSALLSMLLIELSQVHQKMAECRDALITKIIDFLNYNINSFWTIGCLASKYGISPRSLTTRFKAETGQTLHHYQMNMKLEQIAKIIHGNSYYSLKNIARNFGFCDEFHLSQAFKQKFGVSPKNYNRC